MCSFKSVLVLSPLLNAENVVKFSHTHILDSQLISENDSELNIQKYWAVELTQSS